MNHGLDTDERVCFYEQEFYALSNFSSFTVWVVEDGREVIFYTAEHLYHWRKFSVEHGATIRQSLETAPSAHEAYQIAQRCKRWQRPDWDAVKVGIMRDILRAKVGQHEYVHRKLLETGDRELVENSWRDSFWGWGPQWAEHAWQALDGNPGRAARGGSPVTRHPPTRPAHRAVMTRVIRHAKADRESDVS